MRHSDQLVNEIEQVNLDGAELPSSLAMKVRLFETMLHPSLADCEWPVDAPEAHARMMDAQGLLMDPSDLAVAA